METRDITDRSIDEDDKKRNEIFLVSFDCVLWIELNEEGIKDCLYF